MNVKTYLSCQVYLCLMTKKEANRLLLFKNIPNKKSLFLNLEFFQKSKIEGSTNDCQNSSYPAQEWINPTEPPTINKTDGAGVTRSSSL